MIFRPSVLALPPASLFHSERVHLVLDALFSGISFEEFARDTEVSNFKCPLCRKAKKYAF